MKLAELQIFLSDCIKKQIPFPRNTMTVLIEDFYDSIPEEHHYNYDKLEYNMKVGDEFATVLICPAFPKLKPIQDEISCKAEHIITINSFNDWLKKCPDMLPEKEPLEQRLFIDKNGYTVTGGIDFKKVEENSTYPVNVYKLHRIK